MVGGAAARWMVQRRAEVEEGDVEGERCKRGEGRSHPLALSALLLLSLGLLAPVEVASARFCSIASRSRVVQIEEPVRFV
jgi:hypothetical protein